VGEGDGYRRLLLLIVLPTAEIARAVSSAPPDRGGPTGANRSGGTDPSTTGSSKSGDKGNLTWHVRCAWKPSFRSRFLSSPARLSLVCWRDGFIVSCVVYLDSDALMMTLCAICFIFWPQVVLKSCREQKSKP
jgi:hypothetical protein